MKRSEFADIVNAIELEERKRLAATLTENSASPDQLIAELAVEVSAVAARTTAEILIRSGAIHLDG